MKLHPSIKIMSLLMVAVTANTAAAEIYFYVNDSGRKIYVNRLSQVPNKFRQQLIKHRVKVAEISEEEQIALDQKTSALEKKLMTDGVISRLEELRESNRSQVKITNNQVIVPVKIRYKAKEYQLNLLLDTGANVTVLHSDCLPFFDPQYIKPSYAKVANGSLVKTWRLPLQNVSFGPYSSPYHKVTVIKHEGGAQYDGLLGMDLLAQKMYQIDFANQEIIWNPRKHNAIQEKIKRLKLSD